METETIIAIVGAAVSLISAIWAVTSGILARADAKTANMSAENAQQIAKDANQLRAKGWTEQYFDGVRDWGNSVTNAMTAAAFLPCILSDDERHSEWVRIRSELSTYVDTGRWYFPNKFEKVYGNEKPPAYRGYRRRILNLIVASYNAIPCPPECVLDHDGKYQENFDPTETELHELKREFVSEIQSVLDPRQRENQITITLLKFEGADKMKSETEIDSNE